jgi:hypothetical protein
VSRPTPSAVVRSLEPDLQARGAEFSLCDLIDYAQGVWALARLDPDAAAHQAAFLEARGVATRH